VFYIAMAGKSGKKTAIPDGPASGMAVFYLIAKKSFL
jgi:hypothetical protein